MPRRTLRGQQVTMWGAYARRAAERRLTEAHPDEWERLLDEERARYGLGPFDRAKSAAARKPA